MVTDKTTSRSAGLVHTTGDDQSKTFTAFGGPANRNGRETAITATSEENRWKGSLRLVNVDQMAEILGVPKSWIYERTRQGPMAIPHIKLGAYVRFEPEAVIKFFKDKQLQSELHGRHQPRY